MWVVTINELDGLKTKFGIKTLKYKIVYKKYKFNKSTLTSKKL